LACPFLDAPRISCIYGKHCLLTGLITLPSHVDIEDVHPCLHSGKILAHNCLGLLPLATMVANLAKLTPERPALIRHDNDKQAHESGLNNLSIQCQQASKAVTGIADIESKLDSLFGRPSMKPPRSLDDAFCSARGNIYLRGRLCCLSVRTFRGSRYVARYHPLHLVSH
jgi:hypothetical protein